MTARRGATSATMTTTMVEPPGPVPVDRLEVLVLVDNATDSLSTNPDYVVAEWSGLLSAGRLPTLSGERICRAHHGLSLLITAHRGGEARTLLLDAGPEGATFTRNAEILGVDLGAVEAVACRTGTGTMRAGSSPRSRRS